MNGKVAIVVAMAGLISGCATSPENIAPSYTSEVVYQNWTCPQLTGEQMRLSAALSSSSDAQRRARTNDTVGLIFLGMPVSTLSGNNMASEIGRLKGEQQAVQKATILRNCGAVTAEARSPGTITAEAGGQRTWVVPY